MENLFIEVELGNGSLHKMQIEDADISTWNDIEKDTKALLTLIDGQQMLIQIVSADDNGVSFKTIGGKQAYFYEESVIDSLLVEVKKN